MKIVTWNVNSIRARLDRACAFLERHQPDVLCLQELKVTTEAFPAETFAELGYQAAVLGQKTYNGVALLSRTEPDDVLLGMDDGVEGDQARLIAATYQGVRVINGYFPNGGEVGGPRYPYKLEWLGRLRRYLDTHHEPTDKLLLCGDFNVAIDDKDAAQPDKWVDTVLTHAEVRKALSQVTDFGLVDVFRKHHPEGKVYTWWDYRQLAFPKGNGLRIDHHFATEPLAACSTGVEVDRDERKGKSPSDHAPVIATFDLD